MPEVTFIEEYEELWNKFRPETDLPEEDPCPVTALEQAASPGETLEMLFSAENAPATQFLGPRGQEVVRRVRAWLGGPAQAAEAEHARAAAAFEHWLAERGDLPAPVERE